MWKIWTSIWLKTFALWLDSDLFFLRNITQPWIYQPENLTFFYWLPCWQTIMTVNLWRLKNGVRLNLPSNFGYLKLRTIIDLIIHKELGLLKAVYTCFIMSLEIQNLNKISINTILTGWQTGRKQARKI